MAAVNGTIALRGTKTRRLYTYDMYVPDSAGALATFAPSGAAVSGSATFFSIPEDVVVEDISVASGLATAVGGVLTQGSNPIQGTAIRWANQLNTLANRKFLTTGLPANTQIGLTTF